MLRSALWATAKGMGSHTAGERSSVCRSMAGNKSAHSLPSAGVAADEVIMLRLTMTSRLRVYMIRTLERAQEGVTTTGQGEAAWMWIILERDLDIFMMTGNSMAVCKEMVQARGGATVVVRQGMGDLKWAPDEEITDHMDRMSVMTDGQDKTSGRVLVRLCTGHCSAHKYEFVITAFTVCTCSICGQSCQTSQFLSGV